MYSSAIFAISECASYAAPRSSNRLTHSLQGRFVARSRDGTFPARVWLFVSLSLTPAV